MFSVCETAMYRYFRQRRFLLIALDGVNKPSRLSVWCSHKDTLGNMPGLANRQSNFQNEVNSINLDSRHDLLKRTSLSAVSQTRRYSTSFVFGCNQRSNTAQTMPSAKERIVSPETVAEYRSKGAVLLKKVFEPKWVAAVRDGIERNRAHPSEFGEALKGETGEGVYFDDYFNWTKIPEFKDFVYNSNAAQIVAELMESDTAVMYHEHVLVKEPGTSKKTPWHHDQPYYPIDGNKVCSIWMPVDPVPEETCVQFVPGSHLGDRWYIPRKFASEVNYDFDSPNKGINHRKYETVPDIQDGNLDILKWALEPGDCIVFHMRTLHGAPGNVSQTTSRRVLSTRWLGDDAVMAARPWITSPPVMGGLKIGDRAISDVFPLIHSRK